MDSSTSPKSFQKNSWANRLKSQIAGLANETLGLVISRQKTKRIAGHIYLPQCILSGHYKYSGAFKPIFSSG